MATAPNQLWSWDITKLLGPAKWTYFYLHAEGAIMPSEGVLALRHADLRNSRSA